MIPNFPPFEGGVGEVRCQPFPLQSCEVSPERGKLFEPPISPFIRGMTSNTITSFFAQTFCIFSHRLMFGICIPRDCSTASLAILLSLSAFFSFHCLITLFSAGRKRISSTPISESFCTISSAFSRLLGIAMRSVVEPPVPP